MRRKSKFSILALIPAIFMTYICSSFVFVSNQFIGMGACDLAYIYGGGATAIIAGLMMVLIRRGIRNGVEI